MAEAEDDIPSRGVKRGDKVLEIHIPKGGKLSQDEVSASIDEARLFFKKYFPEFDYKCFTCHFRLLDDTLGKYLDEGSKIIKFRGLFEKVREDNKNVLIRYLFRWDTNEMNLGYATPNSSLAERVKKAILNGEQFHEALGVLI